MDDFVTSSPTTKRSVEVINLQIPPDSPTCDDDVQIVEAGEPEMKIIETVEELESVLEDILPDSLEEPLALLPTPIETIGLLHKARLTVPFNMELLRQSLASAPYEEASSSEAQESKRFMARINPDDTEAAEAELSRQINQEDFKKVTS